jgi:hypothetical protein
MNGFWGDGSSALAGAGHLYVETSFFDTVTTGAGTLTSDGWGDVLLMRVPGPP